MNTWINWLIAVTTKGAVWLFIWSWQALALLACMWLGITLARVKSSALRHRIWLLGLIALAAFPFWSILGELLPQPAPISLPLLRTAELPIPAIIKTTVESVTPRTVSAASPIRTLNNTEIALSCLFLAWIIGVTRSLARAAGDVARLTLIRSRAARVTLAELEINESECALSKQAGKYLGLSGEIGSPILVGVLHPMILLPMDIANWTSPVERRAMVLHESAHIARRDHFVNLFQTLLGAVFFFHPLVRYACHRMSLDKEMACDEQVISSGIQAELYAESILKAAERDIALGSAHRLAFFSARQILERRIEMILNTDHGRIIRRNWRYLLPTTALIAMLTWLLIPGRIGNTGQFQYLRGNMTNTTQFQYPDGSDEEVLRTLAQKLAETLPQEDYSMSQYLNPEDCLESEFYWRPMSRTIEDFRERGSVITKIDADIDTPVLSTDGKAYLNFRAVIYFRNSRDGGETTIFRQYGASFKKENGRWQAIRDKEELALSFQSGLAVIPEWITVPIHLGENEASPPAGRGQIHSDSEGVSMALRGLADAILRRDVSALERILTDDYAGWFPEIENNGYAFWGAIGKTQQIAAVEKRRSSVEKVELKKLRVYPAKGGEMGAIAVFIGAPLFQIDGVDPNKNCGYYVRFDKQPEQWKVSMIQMAPIFDMTPPQFPSGGSGETVFEFEFNPDGKNLKNRK